MKGIYSVQLKRTSQQLKKCCLLEAHFREEDLVEFVKGTAVRDLSLEHVVMVIGTFRSIFDYCTTEVAYIDRLYFDELLEKSQLLPVIQFAGPETPKFRPGMVNVAFIHWRGWARRSSSQSHIISGCVQVAKRQINRKNGAGSGGKNIYRPP